MGSVKGRKGERTEQTSRQSDQSARGSAGRRPMGGARGGARACPGVFGFVLLGGGRDGGEESLVLVFFFFPPPRCCFFWRGRRRWGGRGGGGRGRFSQLLRLFASWGSCFPGGRSRPRHREERGLSAARRRLGGECGTGPPPLIPPQLPPRDSRAALPALPTLAPPLRGLWRRAAVPRGGGGTGGPGWREGPRAAAAVAAQGRCPGGGGGGAGAAPGPCRVPVPGHSRASAAPSPPHVRLRPRCPPRAPRRAPGKNRRITQAEREVERRKDSEEPLVWMGGKKKKKSAVVWGQSRGCVGTAANRAG